MAHINLLPWREEALQAQQKLYFTILTAIGLFTLALVLVINFYYQARIDGQNSKNQYLKNEIAVLDIQKSAISCNDGIFYALERVNSHSTPAEIWHFQVFYHS
jgi:type IV pilus assembly protein PilN